MVKLNIFRWLKNHAPVEKNRRTKVRNRDYWSKLVITDLDVLDSGYYQCTATNSAGSVNTTSVLRVSIVSNFQKAYGRKRRRGGLASRTDNLTPISKV